MKKPALRFIPLGGLEEVGKNMSAIEYGNDILVIDMGLMFPNEDMPGIDYVIPDINYLVENKDKIRGVIITHGHLDHTGAIPYLYDKLGSPQIYSAPLTVGLIKKRLEEFGLENRVKLATITPGEDVLQLGVFKVETFRLNHNIPDSMGLAITTPEGILVYATDWKFDHTPADGRPTDFSKLAVLGGQGVLALFSDSTNAQKPGHTISEKEVEDVLFKLVENARGRVIIATFSTLISRIQQILNVARKMNRKVAFSGRSMIANVEIASSLKALIISADIMIDVGDINKFPDNRVLIVCTGSQGEERSALTRIAAGEHRQIKVKKGDTVILSSSPIPGNERSVNDVMDNLFREGARVIYQKLMDVHTSGHAYQEDLKLMIGLIKPKFFIPIHGERHKLMVHAQIAEDVGIPEENILVSDNGQIIEFVDGRGSVTNKRVPASYVMVDGLGVGDVGNIVLRDRKAMAADGIFVVIVTVNHETGQIVTSPDIISRGFIYMRENENLVHKARAEVKRLFAKHAADRKARGDWALIKTKLREDLGKFLYRETERRPMVIPVIIEV
ncbi:ribonuclease J [Candidatus Berkelbacteria bacterium CG1_02_42_45]|uniref:Ribonuclease J n=1 Tax=Candidatus Berkelbacteria bacterium CG1_02_42_45 TaxID=1805036 RepID=A0A1J4RUY9_9BACT|nr:MAG: ribonuclease J [Candidatus Berkelbacteria bacterium CG1_02_42_45]